MGCYNMHAVPSPTRSSPLMQQKHHSRRQFEYIKSITIMHKHMTQTTMHMFTQSIQHIIIMISIYAFPNIDYII